MVNSLENFSNHHHYHHWSLGIMAHDADAVGM